VGGAGLLTIILSNPIRTGFPPPVDDLLDLKASLTLSAVIWGAACAAGGVLFARALVNLLREFIDDDLGRRLSVVPIIVLFIPLLHAALTVAFLNMADVTTVSWDAAALHATGEAGGLAGILAAVPLVILVKAFRDAYDRIVSGEVKPASATTPPAATSATA
jgi:predicted PurR-regulated permease PerM